MATGLTKGKLLAVIGDEVCVYSYWSLYWSRLVWNVCACVCVSGQ